MELTTQKRERAQKKESKRLRREGQIPAVVYGKEGNSENIALSTSEFGAALRKIEKGCLPTTIFTLKGEGFAGQAVIKDIQYHRTSYDVLHLDFEKIEKGRKIAVSVPIHCVGMADCPGIKSEGGVLRQVVRTLPVRGIPGSIPMEVIVDVSDLKLNQSKRLKDISLPKGVEPRAQMDEVVAVIAKR